MSDIHLIESPAFFIIITNILTVKWQFIFITVVLGGWIFKLGGDYWVSH